MWHAMSSWKLGVLLEAGVVVVVTRHHWCGVLRHPTHCCGVLRAHTAQDTVVCVDPCCMDR